MSRMSAFSMCYFLVSFSHGFPYTSSAQSGPSRTAAQVSLIGYCVFVVVLEDKTDGENYNELFVGDWGGQSH